MADLGLFGIKIPKKYGGGLSNDMRILGLLATYCGSSAPPSRRTSPSESPSR